MNKTVKIYLLILLLIFIGIIAIEFSIPKPINWTKTYNETHKRPYGTFIFHDQLNTLFPDSEIKHIRATPYEYFDDYYNWEDSLYTTSGTYLIIDEYPEIDDVSAQELLDFVSHGNNAFIASNYPPKKVLDSLFISIENDYSFKGKASFSLANPVLKKDSLTIEKGLSNYYFSKLDSVTTTVLGYQKFSEDKHINYVKVQYGSGYFYLHLQPVTFTNYSLLKYSYDYAASVLSYLPNDNIHFDSRNKSRSKLSNSPLRFILSNPPLKWAWYLALLSIVIFMIFNAKRKQRIIKIIKSPINTTIAFTKTIGNLYYETKDHNAIIDKKITYFLEYLRRVYYLDTQIMDEKFIKSLALKANKKETDIKTLINLIVHLKAKQDCTETDLLNLNRTIETFHNI